MAKVILSQSAERDVDEILASVYDFTGFISTPERLMAEFIKTFELIAFMPNAIGRLRDDGMREAFCRGYRIVYDVAGDEVRIQTIIHSRRLYPRPWNARLGVFLWGQCGAGLKAYCMRRGLRLN